MKKILLHNQFLKPVGHTYVMGCQCGECDGALPPAVIFENRLYLKEENDTYIEVKPVYGLNEVQKNTICN